VQGPGHTEEEQNFTFVKHSSFAFPRILKYLHALLLRQHTKVAQMHGILFSWG
jgi:hypothetical protein